MLHRSFFDAARRGDLTLHCTKATVTQKLGDELKLSGHGTIKINAAGTIYLEFVCTQADGISRQNLFNSHYPEDPFDSSKKLKLEIETIGGGIFTSSGFSLDIKNNFTGTPLLLYIFLHEIEQTSEDTLNSTGSYLYFEFCEKSLVPKNKTNSTISSLGSESYNWNQTILEFDKSKISIVEHDDYVEVAASGEFEIDKMYDSLTFYIGLTSGCMPQPYALMKRSGKNESAIIRTTNNSYKRKNIPAPIPQNVSIDGKVDTESHYKILENILAACHSRPIQFESTHTQWKRVWHGYNSQNNIAMLSLAVSIEGLLNDIFIPKIKQIHDNQDFEITKNEIIKKISKLEIEEKHKDSINKSIERWGNIHAPKALSILAEAELISETEKKAWEKIRHSSAHPTFIEQSDARQVKEFERMAQCLNLFYRLALNVFGYSGAQYEFGEPRNPSIVIRPYIDILMNTPTNQLH